MTTNELREAYSTNNPYQAEVIKDALKVAGIPAKITGSNLWSAVGDLPAAAIALKILVPVEQYEAARDLAMQYDDPQVKDVGPDWVCYNCEEANAGSFDCCWQCHCDRPLETES